MPAQTAGVEFTCSRAPTFRVRTGRVWVTVQTSSINLLRIAGREKAPAVDRFGLRTGIMRRVSSAANDVVSKNVPFLVWCKGKSTECSKQ